MRINDKVLKFLKKNNLEIPRKIHTYEFEDETNEFGAKVLEILRWKHACGFKNKVFCNFREKKTYGFEGKDFELSEKNIQIGR